jgi:hypothetical protein
MSQRCPGVNGKWLWMISSWDQQHFLENGHWIGSMEIALTLCSPNICKCSPHWFWPKKHTNYRHWLSTKINIQYFKCDSDKSRLNLSKISSHWLWKNINILNLSNIEHFEFTESLVGLQATVEDGQPHLDRTLERGQRGATGWPEKIGELKRENVGFSWILTWFNMI